MYFRKASIVSGVASIGTSLSGRIYLLPENTRQKTSSRASGLSKCTCIPSPWARSLKSPSFAEEALSFFQRRGARGKGISL